MPLSRLRSPFARGAAAGAAAGLLSATVAFWLLEPVLRRAVALEGGGAGPVSRTLQERLGAPVGFIVVGVAYGLLLAAVDRGARAGGTPWRRSLLLSAALFTGLVAFPQLRYPGNPPGVGDPATIGARTGAYLGAVAVGVLLVALLALAARALADDGRLDPARQVLLVAAGLVAAGLLWALLPDNPDRADVPAQLLWDFRVRSLGLNALLWLALGAAYGGLALRAADRSPAATAA